MTPPLLQKSNSDCLACRFMENSIDPKKGLGLFYLSLSFIDNVNISLL